MHASDMSDYTYDYIYLVFFAIYGPSKGHIRRDLSLANPREGR